ncbi:MAG: DUF4153 domain-containing protein [Bacteroidota bacterium]|nr:DUF4153 domain-containing protein [Bacteroidota bacterium]
MKSILSILGGIVFAYLFYSQGMGLNTVFYTVFILIILALQQKFVLLKKPVLVSACLWLGTAIAVSWHSNKLNNFMYCLMGIQTIGAVVYYQSSIYIKWINGIFNILFGSLHRFFEKPQTTQIKEKSSTSFLQYLKYFGIPTFLLIVFLLLYANSNPVMQNILDNIDFSFLNGLWIFTAFLGSLLTANISMGQPVEELVKFDKNSKNELLVPSHLDLSLCKEQNKIGTYSLIALNVLLIFFLITEFVFITQITYQPATSLSNAVHQGVYTSIASIILALIIIVYFFRGQLNFFKKNQSLRKIAYSWLVLNLILIGSVCIKNYTYIINFGLTPKRLGVMIYLFLCVIGIITVYLKIKHKLTFTYLLRRNSYIATLLLVMYSWVNWDAIMTSYNIKNNHIDTELFYELYPGNALILEENPSIKKQIIKEVYSPKISEKSTKKDWQSKTYLDLQLENHDTY